MASGAWPSTATRLIAWGSLVATLAFVSDVDAGTLTFRPVADATIKAGSPTSNYGGASKLATDASPVEEFLLKFSVSGVGSTDRVVSAKLRLYNVSDSPAGGAFYPVADNSWSEGGVTWQNAPVAGATALATLGTVSVGQWYEVDLTAHVSGDGTYSVRVATRASNGADYRSREAGTTYAPQLIVTTAADGGGSGGPAADAGPDQASAEGTALSFRGAGSGTAPLTYRWDFGDGTTATGAAATHAYGDDGTYTATLTVTDAAGRAARDTARATIANLAPIASAGGPYAGEPGRGIAFRGSGTDPGAADAATLSYRWDFGDGTTGTGASATHAYGAGGTYTVRLTVGDKDGGSGSASTTARVTADGGSPPPPPPTTASCLSGTGPLVVVSGTQSGSYSRTLAPDTRIDATGALWRGDDDNPVRVGGQGLCWSGGRIEGTFPSTLDWDTFHGTAALRPVGAVDVVIENVRIVNYGDGIKLYEGTDDFTIRGAYLHDLHDDCIEGDWLPGGSIEDSLLDGCYQAFAARPRSDDDESDGSAKTWTIRNVLAWVRPQTAVYKGRSPGNGAFFKWDTSSGARSPRVAIHDTILRIDQYPNHTEGGLWVPPGKLASCSNVTIVWLGGGPYPVPVPSCVTVTTDVSVWDRAVADWLSRHGE